MSLGTPKGCPSIGNLDAFDAGMTAGPDPSFGL